MLPRCLRVFPQDFWGCWSAEVGPPGLQSELLLLWSHYIFDFQWWFPSRSKRHITDRWPRFQVRCFLRQPTIAVNIFHCLTVTLPYSFPLYSVKSCPHWFFKMLPNKLCPFFLHDVYHFAHFPGGSDSKEFAYHAMQETQIWSLGWEDPLEKGTATHSRVLAWRILAIDRGAWWATVHEVAKSRTRPSD